MARRIPTQIHHRVSRMMKAGMINEPPLWYDAVLQYPPLPLPPKAPPERAPFDTQPVVPSVALDGPRPLKKAKTKPKPIYYLEDEFRRQFYRDHPFEAFRPTTLVESGSIAESHPIQGKEWTRLRQRGRNPSVEDCVRFAVNLHQFHDASVSEAYTRAVVQFRALRAENYCATQFSIMEAEEFGAVFGPTEVQLGYLKEQKFLDTWTPREHEDQGAKLDRKRWKPHFDKPQSSGWTKGQEYVKLWQRGIRPEYAPEALNESPREEVSTDDASVVRTEVLNTIIR